MLSNNGLSYHSSQQWMLKQPNKEAAEKQNFRTLLSNFTWLYGNHFFQLWLVADFPYYIFLL